jgi:hypothetical protein
VRPLLALGVLVAACGSPQGDGSDAAPGVIDAAPGTPDAGLSQGAWLRTEGNHILHADGTRWRARGANLHDTRGCNACTWYAPNPGEVMRRADALLGDWGANLVRLDAESYAAGQEFQVHWADVLTDEAYLDDLLSIVRHITAKEGAYVLLSLWIDPSFDELGWPTAGTRAVWERIVPELTGEPKVLFGLVNEPEVNFDGAEDAAAWTAMNDTVAAIRAVEDEAGTPRHIITVQGTGGWSRRLDYYVTHPITAGGGENVAYEVHVYNPTADFQDMWITPAQTLPVVIGEYGPSDIGNMTEADCTNLMTAARAADVPHIAWTFHMNCAPDLLADRRTEGDACGIDMPLEPTSWGTVFQAGMDVPWP